jgi:hypothetical protein
MNEDHHLKFQKPNDFSLKNLIHRLSTLKQLSPLPILGKEKSKSSAIGESIEEYLGLDNNSSPKPDWGNYELKTTNSLANISLFTIKWDFKDNYDLIKLAFDFGKNHFSNHLQEKCQRFDWAVPYSDVCPSILHFSINHTTVNLKYKDRIIALILLEELKKRFLRKFKNLIIIKIKKINSKFVIDGAYLLNNPSFDLFIESIISQKTKIEFQIFISNPNTQNEKVKRKTSKIRIKRKEIDNLYANKSTLI